MSGFKICLLLYFILLITIGCSGKDKQHYLKAPGFSIFYAGEPESKTLGNYLYNQLKERTLKENTFLLQEKREGFKEIHLEINKQLDYDYSVDCQPNDLILKAKKEEIMLWLIFQLLDVIPRYNEYFVAKDMPAGVLDFHSRKANFDFEYRDPHFSANTDDPEYISKIGGHNVDNCWGLWGHNLKKVFTDDVPGSVYARKNEKEEISQYCFSSDETYKLLESYIYDNFGDSKNYMQRFMIMPNDNLIVCDCQKCKAQGNTDTSATPAVSYLISRLALRFPNHMFFASAYLTTSSPPNIKLPDNTGIIISTIDIPKGIALNTQTEVKTFLETLNKWKEYTENIYIWDYAANFDDYLTPIPILYGLKKQLQFYKSNGVKGVFLNANGYDYASFDDVKTYVASNLMINTKASVDSLCTIFFHKEYPLSGKVLCNYYLSLEKRIQKHNRPYNIYGGFDKAISSYLNMADFVSFYNSLKPLIDKADNEEKHKLQKLYVALTFTRLQIAYLQQTGQYGFAGLNGKKLTVNPEIRSYLKCLSRYENFKNLHSYKEVGGELDLYIRNWNTLLEFIQKENKLFGQNIKIVSKLDEEYNDISVLNDGLIGFEGEYHQGWLLNSSDNLQVKFNTVNLTNANQFSMRFLQYTKHNILLPEKIMIYKDGIFYKEIKNSSEGNDNKIKEFNTDIDLNNSKDISIKIIKSNEAKSIACDEIFLY